MKIIIEATNEGMPTSFNIQDGECTWDMLTATFFSILDAVTKDMLKDADQETLNYFYEHFNGIFELFLRKVFPNPPEGYFELSDAALLYAQDQIIDDAARKGITFEEALKKYEKKAKEYIREKKEGLA